MKIEEIISLVLHILSVLGYVIIAVIVAIKKHKNATKTDSSVDYDKVFDTYLISLTEMMRSETLYKSVFKDGIKAGAFKLRDVLTTLKNVCAEKNIPYDKDKWTKFINDVVKFQNIVQSTVHVDNAIVNSTEVNK